jgi:LacI family fructose operon transcriptional repressor
MAQRRSKPTIHDIARLSEASASTVSAVLSGSWKDRRISEATAKRIRAIAAEQGYSPNLQARGLRRARSGLVGMILPVHDNHFFAEMSQCFEAQARARGLCPVIVSTLRDPDEERRTVETLIAYAIDSVLIAGATDPGAAGRLCRAADIPHVFVDLPGADAPSVISDNYAGAALLTRRILSDMAPGDRSARARPYFIGGVPDDHASARRIAAFHSVLGEAGPVLPGQVLATGYSPTRARNEIMRLCDRLGGLPAGLFINSLTVFEGVLTHFVTLPLEAFANTVIGCYDYDPFAAFLQFPVHMVRQNSAAMVARAFELIEAGDRAARMIEVEPELIPPRTIYPTPFFAFG